jgi:hypothetical protein
MKRNIKRDEGLWYFFDQNASIPWKYSEDNHQKKKD